MLRLAPEDHLLYSEGSASVIKGEYNETCPVAVTGNCDVDRNDLRVRQATRNLQVRWEARWVHLFTKTAFSSSRASSMFCEVEQKCAQHGCECR